MRLSISQPLAVVRAAAVFLLATSSIVLPQTSMAQNTGGVFSPVVNDGHSSAQYRIGYDPDTDLFAHRIHYQRSLDTKYMWRVVAQARKTESSDNDFDFLQGELFVQISEGQRDWLTGVRFDVRIRDAGRHQTLGVNWMNQFRLGSEWRGRLNLLTSIDTGGGRSGIGLQTRANVFRSNAQDIQYGLGLFSSYGTTSDFAALDDQQHVVGPFVVVPVADGWSMFAGALFGLTDASRDSDLRLWVTRSF